MCSPTAFLGTQAIGAVGSAYGAYQGASAQQGVLNTQAYLDNNLAGIADINAGLAEQQAKASLEQGQKQEQSLMLKYAQVKSNQRTGIASNNVDLSSRSSRNVMVGTDLMKEIDVNQTHVNAMRASWGYKTQATNYRNQGLGLRAKSAGGYATANAISPTSSMFSSLLSSASSIAGNYYLANKAGMFDKKDTSGKATFNLWGDVNSESDASRWGEG